MSAGAEPLLIGERPTPAEPRAPMLPIEQPIVAAALAANEVKNQADLLLWYLSHAPRQDAAVSQVFAKAQASLNEAWKQYVAYREIMNCQGSA